MGHGTKVGFTADIRKVSCYCSNTAGGDLYAGRAVGLCYTDTLTNAVHHSGTLRGFGAAIDYAEMTDTVVVGILDWGPPSRKAYWEHGTWADVITRGPCAHALGAATVGAKAPLFPTTIVGAYYGYVDDLTGDGTQPQTLVGYSVGANSGTSGTIAIFVNTLFA